MKLLYYLPGKKTADIALLRAYGLGHAFDDDDRRHLAPVLANGPDDGAGVIVTDADHPRPGYYANNQKWRKVPLPDGDARPKAPAWVGYYTASPPTSNELARRELLQGAEVELGDGNRWRVPIVVGAPESGSGTIGVLRLPSRLDLDDSGLFVPGEVLPAYAPLQHVAEWWCKLTLENARRYQADGDKAELLAPDIQELYKAAVAGLAANYRIGAAEAVLLGLLDMVTADRIVAVMMDQDGYAALRKKVDSAGSDSDAGPADGNGAIAPR